MKERKVLEIDGERKDLGKLFIIFVKTTGIFFDLMVE